MRYLKTYEKHYHNEPNEGDYVICKTDEHSDFLNNFYGTTIGKIISVIDTDTKKYYKVQYDIIPDKKEFFKEYKQSKLTRQLFDRDEILYFSKNREYLEMKLTANKYNL